jgi:hypothetical protein
MDNGALSRLLLISGTGRDSGKTSFACLVIEKFKLIEPLVAFKMSPHRHKVRPGGSVIWDEERIFISEENDSDTGKDSSRMLAAGAKRSFFVMAADEGLLKAWDIIQRLSGAKAFIIGESGGLRRYLKPGLFIMVGHADENKRKPDPYRYSKMADAFVIHNENDFDFNLNNLVISDNKWKINWI